MKVLVVEMLNAYFFLVIYLEVRGVCDCVKTIGSSSHIESETHLFHDIKAKF